MKETGLTPVEVDGQVAFEEATSVLVCKKLYVQEMTADCFAEKDLVLANYGAGDFHTAYYGEIVKAYVK